MSKIPNWEGASYPMNVQMPKVRYTTVDNANIFYCQFEEKQPVTDPIATSWLASGDWFIFSPPHKEGRRLAFIHTDHRDNKSEFSMDEIAAMFNQSDASKIFGYEEKYKDELLSYMLCFLNDCIQEMHYE